MVLSGGRLMLSGFRVSRVAYIGREIPGVQVSQRFLLAKPDRLLVPSSATGFSGFSEHDYASCAQPTSAEPSCSENRRNGAIRLSSADSSPAAANAGVNAAAPVLLQKLTNGIFMPRPVFRRFFASSTPHLRLWLAKTSEAPFWRQLLGIAPRSSSGILREVRLPPKAKEVNGLALGGGGVLVVSDGQLLSAPLGMSPLEEGHPDAMELREMSVEPHEEVGVTLADLMQHVRASEALGIPLVLGRTTAGASSQQQDGTGDTQFVKVTAGLNHCAALTSHGILYTWGRGGAWGAGSPLGHGDTKSRPRPTPVAQFIAAREFVVDVACGAASTCVVTSSGRVFSSGAADFGLNGSGMLVSSKVFRELESFRRRLCPDLFESQSRNEEIHLRDLEVLKKEMDREGLRPSPLGMRPFEASQETQQDTAGNTPADTGAVKRSLGEQHASPRVACGAYHCGLLTAEGDLWLWGRNDCLQLSQEKIVSPSLCSGRRRGEQFVLLHQNVQVMASGGESNYPILADFFTRSDVRVESCALGPSHSLAIARNGLVYEWGGAEAAPPHPVDLHWSYPESIFKSRVIKVACGGTSTSAGFSSALTENGEIFFWGPGVSMLALGVKPSDCRIPARLSPSVFAGDPTQQQNVTDTRIVDIAAGPLGCLIVTSHSRGLLRPTT